MGYTLYIELKSAFCRVLSFQGLAKKLIEYLQ